MKHYHVLAQFMDLNGRDSSDYYRSFPLANVLRSDVAGAVVATALRLYQEAVRFDVNPCYRQTCQQAVWEDGTIAKNWIRKEVRDLTEVRR